jgi:hypothetical protein
LGVVVLFDQVDTDEHVEAAAVAAPHALSVRVDSGTDSAGATADTAGGDGAFDDAADGDDVSSSSDAAGVERRRWSAGGEVRPGF